MQKAIVLVSGGLDSSVILAKTVSLLGAENVMGLCMHYGQKHSKEIKCARAVCAYYDVVLMEEDMSEVFKGSQCTLLEGNADISHKSYAEQIEEEGTVSAYVPFRNGLFLSYAASKALIHGADYIMYGAHADDAAGNAYPDCSENFYDAMHQAIYQGTGHKVKLVAPYINKNKSEIVKDGIELKVPFDITWSCYEGNKKACGRCGTCIDRMKAFEENGWVDPIPYVIFKEHPSEETMKEFDEQMEEVAKVAQSCRTYSADPDKNAEIIEHINGVELYVRDN